MYGPSSAILWISIGKIEHVMEVRKMKMKRMAAFVLAVWCAIGAGAQEDGGKTAYSEVDSLFGKNDGDFSFVAYAGFASGAGFAGSEATPSMEAVSGIVLFPWLSLGLFTTVNPLSNFEDANLGLSIADVEAAYAVMSGTEIAFTPWYGNVIHPLATLRLGRIAAGNLIDDDGEEGYETVREDKYFFASLSLGAEANLTAHVRLALKGGWRFAANEATMGIEEGGLSGPEVSLGLRILWRNVLD